MTQSTDDSDLRVEFEKIQYVVNSMQATIAEQGIRLKENDRKIPEAIKELR